MEEGKKSEDRRENSEDGNRHTYRWGRERDKACN
jgi:hypothetical protein